MERVIFFILSFVFLSSCRQPANETKITINIKGAAGKKIFLYKEPFVDELPLKIDSATVVDLNHPLVFKITADDQRLYRLQVENSINSYNFINDVTEIKIDANDINGKYSIQFSPASNSLKSFNEQQAELARNLRKKKREIDSLQKLNLNTDSLNQIFKISFVSYTNNYLKYADTVTNPAALMSVYLNINFGNDNKALTTFVDNSSKRFPDYEPIKKLKKETYELLSIFEKEYNIGDTLPVISLSNDKRIPVSTEQFKGGYCLIDFWATWCPQCQKYNYYKKQLWTKYKEKNFAVVSVALDDDWNVWLNTISNEELSWTQLIDEKMWQGTAANTLKFDSIPFNFLVNPQGIIVEKAIKADSLEIVVSKYLK